MQMPKCNGEETVKTAGEARFKLVNPIKIRNAEEFPTYETIVQVGPTSKPAAFSDRKCVPGRLEIGAQIILRQ